jgi:hypothetical protein
MRSSHRRSPIGHPSNGSKSQFFCQLRSLFLFFFGVTVGKGKNCGLGFTGQGLPVFYPPILAHNHPIHMNDQRSFGLNSAQVGMKNGGLGLHCFEFAHKTMLGQILVTGQTVSQGWAGDRFWVKFILRILVKFSFFCFPFFWLYGN